ncbi:fructoselysine 6-kinase [Ammoniphilus sp. YIM 78166]|uniref:fructoselysine 6-kinase n=1 Tax=Ammoniphilus sp. YIM 78166 TaxID=1644106 RepID=UPI00196AE9E7|nr:fructoselysine 6-kinase [Ammoniphilus sp. YIM 78166]
MRVAGVGFNCIDLYENLNKHYPTGNSVDFVIHLSRMGVDTSMISVIGDDVYGGQMADLLQNEGIDISHLHVKKGSTAIYKMDLNGNDRVHKEMVEGVMSSFSLTDEDIAFIKEHDVLHTNLSGKIMGLLPQFKEHGILTVFDFSVRVNEIPESILPSVDYAFFSYDKGEDEFILDYLKWAKDLGPKVVIATLGEKGSIAYDGESYYREGIVKVEVVNTVGAGDSFCAGFMYGILQNWSIQESLHHGAKVASQVVMKFEPY